MATKTGSSINQDTINQTPRKNEIRLGWILKIIGDFFFQAKRPRNNISSRDTILIWSSSPNVAQLQTHSMSANTSAAIKPVLRPKNVSAIAKAKSGIKPIIQEELLMHLN